MHKQTQVVGLLKVQVCWCNTGLTVIITENWDGYLSAVNIYDSAFSQFSYTSTWSVTKLIFGL